MVQNRLIIVASLLFLVACSKYKTEVDKSLYGSNFRGHSRQYWDSVDKPFWNKLDSVAVSKNSQDDPPSSNATVGFTSGNTTKVTIYHPSIMIKQIYYINTATVKK